MADRIKGITVEIGGDVTGLNKALSSTNKEIKATQDQLKDVERLLKLDPKNTELLAQKQRLLGDAVKENVSKLDTLKKASEGVTANNEKYEEWQKSFSKIQEQTTKAQKELSKLQQEQEKFTEGSEDYNRLQSEIDATTEKIAGLEKKAADTFDELGRPISTDQYDALQREIVATEKNLESLQEQAKNSNVAIAKIGETAKQVAEGSKRIADATKGISAGAAAGVAGLVAMATHAGLAADDINTLAKQSGFGTDEIQKWQYAADRMDVSVDTIIGSAQKMKKNMVSTSASTIAAWERIGVAVTNSNGELRNSTDVFYETVEALSKIPNETERDTLAMQLFGKSADDLAGIIDDGGAALKEMGEEAERNGLILSQDALDGANKFNDGLDTLKAKAQQAFFESGASMAETLLPLLDTLVEKGSQVLEWISNLDGDTLAVIGTVLLAVAAISPIASTISGISTAISVLSGAISFLTSPIVLVTAAVVAAVLLIATKGDEIQAILQKLDDWLQGVFATDWTTIFGPVLGSVLNAFFANVKNIWDSIKMVFDGVIDFIRGVFTGDWDRAWSGIVEIFSGIWGLLESAAKVPLNGIIGLLNGAIGAINMLIGGLNGMGFKLPDWLGGGSFSINIPTIPNIPYLAKGGILSQGTAMVGEEGPELLTVGNGKAVVQPLSGNNGHLDSQVGSSTTGTPGALEIVVPVNLDGYRVGEATYRYIQQRERAYG